MVTPTNPTQNSGGLVSLIQGIQRPLYPANMETLDPGVQKWIRDITDYLRRLASLFTAANIITTINPSGGFLVDWQYDTTSHKFQVKAANADGTIGAWTNTGGGQPVEISELVEELTTSGGFLADVSISNVFVLEKGSESTLESACGCSTVSGGGGGDPPPPGPGDGTGCVLCGRCSFSPSSKVNFTYHPAPRTIFGIPWNNCADGSVGYQGPQTSSSDGTGVGITWTVGLACNDDGTIGFTIYGSAAGSITFGPVSGTLNADCTTGTSDDGSVSFEIV